MQEQIGKTMLSLLRAEICGESVENIDKEVLTEDGLKALLALSNKHDVAHLIAHTLIKNNLINKKSELFSKFYLKEMTAVVRHEKNEFALKELCNALETEGRDYVALKGAVIKWLYPEPWMRMSCDIDVLVEEENVEKLARTLTRKYGYEQLSNATTHDISLSTPNGVHLELHFSLTQSGSLPKTDRILKSVWNYAYTVEGYNHKCELDPEMIVFYHVAHMAKHFLNGGCGVKPFLDLYLIKKNMPYPEDKLVKLLKSGKLIDFYNQVLGLIGVWFKNNRHTEITKQMENYVLTGGVYGTVKNAAIVKAGKGKSKAKTFFELMFLPRRNLEVLYPNLKKHRWMYPLYQVKRWFKIFNKKSRQNVKSQIAARNSVTAQEKDAVNNLLKNLGI